MTGGDVDALDASVRAAAFRFLSEQTNLHPDGVLPREVVAAGFNFQGRRVPLVGPQGIFKPAVRPDLVVHVREDVRNEADGPMLRHGLQGFHGARIHVPRSEPLRPNREFLEERYAWFRRAA